MLGSAVQFFSFEASLMGDGGATFRYDLNCSKIHNSSSAEEISKESCLFVLVWEYDRPL